VTKVLDDVDKVRNKSNLPSDLDEFIPQRLVDFMEKAKVIMWKQLTSEWEGFSVQVQAKTKKVIENSPFPSEMANFDYNFCFE